MKLSRKPGSMDTGRRRVVLAAVAAIVLISWGGDPVRSARPTADSDAAVESVEVGHSIFHREWLVDDPRSHRGDGLGPLFNESSCVACHNMGGAGGAGPIEKNVELLTAVLFEASGAVFTNVGEDGSMVATDSAGREQLAAVHPDFRDGDTVVLHRFGTDRETHTAWQATARSGGMLAQQQFAQPVFDSFEGAVFEPSAADVPLVQQAMPQQFVDPSQFSQVEVFGVVPGSAAVDSNQFPVISRVLQRIAMLKQDVHSINANQIATGVAVIQSSQRNTSSLFGIGLIDAIPEEAIEAVAERQASETSAVSGRIHRLEDDRIGRFGWKAQKASLYDFTMAACAVELGLHVPEHAQTEVPYDAEYKAPGLDLDQEQVDALVAYLRELPPPVQNTPEDDAARGRIRRGEELFETAGCAACHVQQMGDVEGLYSDLLLHDLGGELGGSGHYGVQPSLSPEDPESLELSGADKTERPPGPSATEWRTPPLWGVRDSGPYLHDGRARTLETAISFHGAEAADSRLKFFLLPEEDQQMVIAFLKTLTAPDATN